jgi:iron complex outermembrane receptor protein
LLKFSPSASWLVTVDSSHDKGAGPAAFGITSGTLASASTPSQQVEGRIDDRASGVMSELKFDLGAVDLVYLFGHRKSSRDDQSSLAPAPSVYSNSATNFSQISHEVRLSSAGSGPLQWVAGAYYFDEVGHDLSLDLRLPAAFGGGRAIHFFQDPAISESKALFGQSTYAWTDDWRTTFGLRANNDHKYRDGQTRVGPNDTPIGKVGNHADASWSKLTYKLGVEHDLNRSIMAYANLATGYKAGGFNDGNAVVGDPNYNANLYYKPESITSLEAGLKGRFLDNRLRLGASAFYYNYTNLQVASIVNNSLNTSNAGKATVAGVEFEGRAKIAAHGDLSFALGLLDAKYQEYTTAGGIDFNGKSLDRAPKASLTLGYTHDWELEDGATITAYLGTHYATNYTVTDVGNTAANQPTRSFAQSSATKSDLSFMYAPSSERWSVQAFVKNIEDKRTITALVGQNGADFAYLTAPRTAGLRVNVKF